MLPRGDVRADFLVKLARHLAQRGAFAPDGVIAALVPLTTVIWILAQAAALPRSWRAAALASARR